MTSDKLKLVIINNVFKRSDQDKTIKFIDYNNETLKQLIDLYTPKYSDVAISITSGNGGTRLLSDYDVLNYQLKPNDVVYIIPSIRGGGGGGKQILGIVAMIALAYVSFGVGNLVQYGTWSAMAGGSWGLGASLAAMGVMMAGGILINALFPPVTNLDNSNATKSQTYSWNPQTVQGQGGVVPKFYGLFKTQGNVIATNVETISDKSYLNILIDLGFGPIYKISEFKINDQPIKNLQGVSIYSRKGKINQSVIDNFNDTKAEYPVSIIVKYGTPIYYTTIGNSFDQIEVDLYSPGIYSVNTSGGIASNSVNVEVDIRKLGDTVWYPITLYGTDTINSAGIWSAGYWSYTPPYGTWISVATGSSNSLDHQDGDFYGYIYSGNPYLTINWRWIEPGDTYYSNLTITYDTIKASQTNALTRTYKSGKLTHGIYELQISKLTAERNSVKYGDDIYLSAVREVIQDDFTYPRSTLVGIKALASDQLSGSLRFSCYLDGSLVRVYRNGIWDVEYNNNTAWVCYDILTQPVLIDLWEPNYSFNYGNEIVPTTLKGKTYECSATGTTGSTEPTWPITIGAMVYDGNITWTCKAGKTTDGVYRFDGIDPSKINLTDFSTWASYCDGIIATKGTTTTVISSLVADATIVTVTSTSSFPSVGGIDSYTKLLLRGQKDVVEVIDISPSSNKVYVVGNVIVDNKQTKLAEYSIKLNGKKGTYLYCIDNDDWDFGSGDFTVDWFEFRTNRNSTSSVVTREGTNAFSPFVFGYDSGNTITARISSNGTSWDIANDKALGTITLNQWKHHGISRNGNVMYGLNHGSIMSTWTATGTIKTSTALLDIGRYNRNFCFPGYLSEVRITKGQALYISAYTVPTVQHSQYQSATIADSLNDGDTFNYTGKTATAFTGCTGVLAHNAGAVVGPENDVERRCTFNGGFDSEMTLWEAALRTCQNGNAALLWNGNEIKVIVDKERTPAHLYSMGNIVQGSFKETFLASTDRISEVDIDYNNKSKDYERTQLTIYNPNIDNLQNKTSLQVLGVTSDSQAWRSGRLILAHNELEKRVVEFDVDIDALANNIGDIIYFQHDVPLNWGQGGRLVSATTNTITLDQDFGIEGGKSYEVLIRLSSDTIVNKTISTSTPGTYTTVSVNSNFSVIPAIYDVYAIGEVGKVKKIYSITDIDRSQDMQFHLTCLEYNSSVYLNLDGDYTIRSNR